MITIPEIKIKQGKVWDIIRKKWIAIFPEELLRQKVIHYLVYEKKYPRSLIAVEKEFNFNGLKKRFDILVFTKAFKPYILVECKREEVAINKSIYEQILPYVLELNPVFLMLTNGKKMLVYERINQVPQQIQTIPICDF